MTASDLAAALQPVADAFNVLGVRYYLGGSVASSAHGVARASLDADIVAFVEQRHVDRLVELLEAAYYVPVDRVRTAVAEGHRARQARMVPARSPSVSGGTSLAS